MISTGVRNDERRADIGRAIAHQPEQAAQPLEALAGIVNRLVATVGLAIEDIHRLAILMIGDADDLVGQGFSRPYPVTHVPLPVLTVIKRSRAGLLQQALRLTTPCLP